MPTAVEGAEFMWMGTEWDESFTIATEGEWQDQTTAKAVFSIPQGQAVVINATEGIAIQNAGQVPSEKVSFTTIDQNNFTGNPFPAAIDIQNIKIIGSGGWGTEIFSVWEGLPTAVEGAEFMWMGTEWDESFTVATKGEWQDQTTARAEYSIAPNQGVVINASAGLTVEIDPPYSL